MIAVQRGTFLSIGEKRDAPGFTLISATDVISAVIYTPRPAARARCARNSEINRARAINPESKARYRTERLRGVGSHGTPSRMSTTREDDDK